MKATVIRIRQFVKDNKLEVLIDVALFAIITYSLHWLWWHWIWSTASDGGFLTFLPAAADFLAHEVFLSSSWVLNVLGVEHTAVNNTIFLKGNGYVEVLLSCSGLKQFYQIFFLFLLFPGPWKHKLWYIPAALLIMHGVNIMRIVILSLVLDPWPEYWDFIHMWILRPFFYVVIFGFWVLWNEKFRPMTRKSS